MFNLILVMPLMLKSME